MKYQNQNNNKKLLHQGKIITDSIHCYKTCEHSNQMQNYSTIHSESLWWMKRKLLPI